jgi:hypothetical protein
MEIPQLGRGNTSRILSWAKPEYAKWITIINNAIVLMSYSINELAM